MFTEVLFTTDKIQNPAKCPLKDEQKSERGMHPMGYYSALTGKEILTRATMWMNLEVITLSEICQPQKDKYYIIPFNMRYLEQLKITETESRMIVATGQGVKWGVTV